MASGSIHVLQTPVSSYGNWLGSTTLYYETSSDNEKHKLTLGYIHTGVSGYTVGFNGAVVTYSVYYGGRWIRDHNTFTLSSMNIQDIHLGWSFLTDLEHSAQTKQILFKIDKVVFKGNSAYGRPEESTGGRSSEYSYISIPAKTSYSITYNAHAGSDTCSRIPSSQTKWYNESLSLSSWKPTRKNYMFVRWNTNASNTGTSYSPGNVYTNNASATLYAIWNAIIVYDAQGGTGAPKTEIKKYNETLVLSSKQPTRSGYQFLGWNTAKDGTGTSYSPGANYTSNNAVTLYAKWKKLHSAPIISSMTCVRWQNNRADDSGTQCKVDIRWSIDTSVVSSAQLRSITGTISPSVGGSSTFSFTVSPNSANNAGTATATISGCDTDTQYLITATVTDNQKNSSNAYYSTSRSDILTRASFVIDFKAGGKAIGIGSAAPSNGLEIGWPTQFDKPVTTLDDVTIGTSQDPKDLTVTGDIVCPQLSVVTIDDAVSAGSNYWTVMSQKACIYGKVMSLQVTLSASASYIEGNSMNLFTLKSQYRPAVHQWFSTEYGHGDIVGSSAKFYCTESVPASYDMEVGLTYIMA